MKANVARSTLPVIQSAALLLFLFLGVVAIRQLPWLQGLDPAWLNAHLQSQSSLKQLEFILLCAGLTALGVPRQFLAFAAGALFGISFGTLISTAGVTLGAFISYTLARGVLASAINKNQHLQFKKLSHFLHTKTFRVTLAIRLLPVGNNLLTNLIAGASHIPLARFLAGSFVGYIPQMLIFALAGAGAAVSSQTQLILGFVLLIGASVLGWHLYRVHQAYLPVPWHTNQQSTR